MTADAAPTTDTAGVRIREAAPQLGMAERTLRRWCASGSLEPHARQRGRVWFLNPDWVRAQVTWPSAESEVA